MPGLAARRARRRFLRVRTRQVSDIFTPPPTPHRDSSVAPILLINNLFIFLASILLKLRCHSFARRVPHEHVIEQVIERHARRRRVPDFRQRGERRRRGEQQAAGGGWRHGGGFLSSSGRNRNSSDRKLVGSDTRRSDIRRSAEIARCRAVARRSSVTMRYAASHRHRSRRSARRDR